MPWRGTSSHDNPPTNLAPSGAGTIRAAPLDGIRIIDCSLLGPGALTMHLTDLGAEVIKVEVCSISGFGSTGPYQSIPSHGVAFDAWAGLVAAILQARTTGEGSQVEIAQADAAAAMDWLRSETWMIYRRRDEDRPNTSHEHATRRAPGTAGIRDGVRYQFCATRDDRHVLFMTFERVF